MHAHENIILGSYAGQFYIGSPNSLKTGLDSLSVSTPETTGITFSYGKVVFAALVLLLNYESGNRTAKAIGKHPLLSTASETNPKQPHRPNNI